VFSCLLSTVNRTHPSDLATDRTGDAQLELLGIILPDCTMSSINFLNFS
jgi:hypothetical protein